MALITNEIPEERGQEGSGSFLFGNRYENLSQKAKNIAPQIESLLDGLNVGEIQLLLMAVKRTIEDKSTFVLSANVIDGRQ